MLKAAPPALGALAPIVSSPVNCDPEPLTDIATPPNRSTGGAKRFSEKLSVARTRSPCLTGPVVKLVETSVGAVLSNS